MNKDKIQVSIESEKHIKDFIELVKNYGFGCPPERRILDIGIQELFLDIKGNKLWILHPLSIDIMYEKYRYPKDKEQIITFIKERYQ